MTREPTGSIRTKNWWGTLNGGSASTKMEIFKLKRIIGIGKEAIHNLHRGAVYAIAFELQPTAPILVPFHYYEIGIGGLRWRARIE